MVLDKNLGVAERFLTTTIRARLKNRILVQDRGGAYFLTGGILLYIED